MPEQTETPEIRFVAERAPEGSRAASLSKIFEVKRDAQSRQALALRAHDVTAAIRSLRFAVMALQSGYRFDDDNAGAKIEAMARAVAVLEKEMPLWRHLYV